MFDKIKTAFLGWILGLVKERILGNWESTLSGILGLVLVKYVQDPQQRVAIIAGTVAAVGAFAGGKLPPKKEQLSSTSSPMSAAIPVPDLVKVPSLGESEAERVARIQTGP